MENSEAKTLICLLSIVINNYLGVRSIFIFISAICWAYFILYFGEKYFQKPETKLGFIVLKDLASKSKILLRRSTNIFYNCDEFFNTTILFSFIFEHIINTDKNPLSKKSLISISLCLLFILLLLFQFILCICHSDKNKLMKFKLWPSL